MFLSRLTFVSAVLVLATACGSSSSTPSTAPSPTPQPAPTPAPAPTPTPGVTSATVSIPTGASTLGNRAYVPDDVNISVGGTVTWMNTDSISHTSTSDATAWDSGIVAPGGQFSFAFQTAGTYRYHCAIHPGMIGTVNVH